MRNFEIELSSCYVSRPRVYIDLVNPPENLEEIVQTYFGDYLKKLMRWKNDE